MRVRNQHEKGDVHQTKEVKQSDTESSQMLNIQSIWKLIRQRLEIVGDVKLWHSAPSPLHTSILDINDSIINSNLYLEF